MDRLKRWLPFYRWEVRTLILFVLLVQVFLNSLALFHLRHYPPVIAFNPLTNVAEVLHANRDQQALLDLFRGGFLQATAMATGSHPYELPKSGQVKIHKRIIEQFFAPEAAREVQGFRDLIAVHHAYGTVTLSFNSFDPQRLKIEQRAGFFYFESFFNQTYPMDGQKRIRTFHVRATGNLAPATMDNPYNIKFNGFRITEVQPKTPKN